MCLSLASISFLSCIFALLYFPATRQSAIKTDVENQRVAAGLENAGFEDNEHDTLPLPSPTPNLTPGGVLETSKASARTNQGIGDGIDPIASNMKKDTPAATMPATIEDVTKPRRLRTRWKESIRLRMVKEMQMLGSPIFLAIALALVGNGISNSIGQFKVVLLTERGFSNNDAALYLTVQAVASIVITPLMGQVLSLSKMKPYVKYLYAAACILNGAGGILYGCITSFQALLILGAVQATAKTTINGQLSGILCDLFGKEQMLQYTAGARVFQGIAFLMAPTLAGKFY